MDIAYPDIGWSEYPGLERERLPLPDIGYRLNGRLDTIHNDTSRIGADRYGVRWNDREDQTIPSQFSGQIDAAVTHPLPTGRIHLVPIEIGRKKGWVG